MKPRYIVAAVLLFFAWQGSHQEFQWPNLSLQTVKQIEPSEKAIGWAGKIAPIAKGMLYTDRVYLSNLYDAMAFVLEQDGLRKEHIMGDTDRLATFHAGTLQFAIDNKKVGSYPGLSEAIDAAFFAALGEDVADLDDAKRADAIDLCRALRRAFRVGENG